MADVSSPKVSMPVAWGILLPDPIVATTKQRPVVTNTTRKR